jgi:chemotaxis protein methyltransferase CheR
MSSLVVENSASSSGNSFDKLSDADFKRLSEIVQARLGIRMPISKKIMVQSRLLRRLRALRIRSYRDYCNYLIDSRDTQEEMTRFLDLMTTNKTAFFREPEHFNFLTQDALPALYNSRFEVNRRHIAFWSAACSSGEEPYTIAIVIDHFISSQNIEWTYSVLGTDVSTVMLDRARKAIYNERDIDTVTFDLKKKYFLRSKDRSKGTVRIVPELRSKVTFQPFNFVEDTFTVNRSVNVIFCRNALIYFERKRQEYIINRLCEYLKPQGYFIVGLSEALHGLDVPLKPAGRSIYVRI